MTVDKTLAKSLMDIKAVLLRPQDPFTWASGWHSPIYCDNRRILSHPELRSSVADWLAEKAMELYPKDHGTGSQIEGELPKGKKVVVIEDLISTGMSSLAAVKALREAGADVLGMVAIFTYGFDLASQRFAEEGVRLDTLSNYGALVSVASETGYITAEDEELLHKWRESPDTWGK